MSATALSYRREIDGLRAVAVLPVILFHAGFQAFSGGFVGVDVFFVISGYLITTIILREQGEGRFSILAFYERRARRILPALFVVIAACVPFALAWMLPWQLVDFGRSAIAVATFTSNILFWRTSGYFHPNAEELPLLHTWSLAVEEQYYIILPLMMMLLAPFGRRRLAVVIAVLTVGSLLLTEWAWRNQPSANFYLLPTRAWELFAGSLLAIWMLDRERTKGLANEAGGLLGLALIVGAIFLFDSGTPFPSLWTLAPVLGAGLIILCAGPDTLAGRLLAWRPLVGVGLVSYSAYLWHQPLFAFARIRSLGEPSTALMALLALAALALAYLTWRFVERPFRNRARMNRRRIFAWAAAGTAVLISGGIALDLSRGAPFRIPAEHRAWASLSPSEQGGYVEAAYGRALDVEAAAGQPSLLIVGDSFSQDFYNIVRESGAFPGYSVSTLYVPTVCQIYRGSQDASQFRKASDRAVCERSALEGDRLERIRRADVVVIAARWRPWSVERIGETVRNLHLRPHQTLLVVGGKGFDPEPERYLRRGAPAPADAIWPVTVEAKQRDLMLRDRLPAGAVFVDIRGQLCSDSCPVFTPEGELISHDGSHLTKAGATHIGRILFSSGPLAEYGRR